MQELDKWHNHTSDFILDKVPPFQNRSYSIYMRNYGLDIKTQRFRYQLEGKQLRSRGEEVTRAPDGRELEVLVVKDNGRYNISVPLAEDKGFVEYRPTIGDYFMKLDTITPMLDFLPPVDTMLRDIIHGVGFTAIKDYKYLYKMSEDELLEIFKHMYMYYQGISLMNEITGGRVSYINVMTYAEYLNYGGENYKTEINGPIDTNWSPLYWSKRLTYGTNPDPVESFWAKSLKFNLSTIEHGHLMSQDYGKTPGMDYITEDNIQDARLSISDIQEFIQRVDNIVKNSDGRYIPMSMIYDIIMEYKYKTNIPGICLYDLVTRDRILLEYHSLEHILSLYYYYVDVYRTLAESFAEAYPKLVRGSVKSARS